MKRAAFLALCGGILVFAGVGCATSNAYQTEPEPVAGNEAVPEPVRPEPLTSSYVATERQVEQQAKALPTEPVNLNSATIEQLKRIPGVDDQLASQIIFYRSKAGRFYNVDQLLQVKGMDAERLELVRQWVTVDISQDPAAVAPSTAPAPKASEPDR